ncbi:hypothetical protein [Chamaesiphon sp. GL140_3_metabinner_50]|nr:hypothetical protein [Chamaesiphon sp. GL140_3_metabinner_50]
MPLRAALHPPGCKSTPVVVSVGWAIDPDRIGYFTTIAAFTLA